jgi:membrane associated rhomboid family serine protease
MSSIRDDIRQVFSRGNSSGVQLILINLFVFVGLFLIKAALSFSQETSGMATVVDENLLLNARVPEFLLRPWTLLTFGFINQSVFGFLFNAISLYWFGMLIQDFIGNRKVVNIYLLGYFFAGIFYIFAYNLAVLSKSQINLSGLVTGSTSAVYAVIFATITLVPNYEFFLFRRFYVKIKYLALLFLALSFLNPTMGALNLGGAFLGYLYIKLLRVGIDLASPIETVRRWFLKTERPERPSGNYSSKQYSHSTVGKSSAFQGTSQERAYYPDQEEIDALLDKISVSGYDSLTKEEKQRLYLASKNQPS